MNTNSKSYSDFNELLFENKNKQYGAYLIRKSQNETIRTSLLITLTSFGILSLWAVWVTNKKIDIPKLDVPNDPPVTTSIIEVVFPPKDKQIIEPKQKVETAPKTTTGQMEASDNKKDIVEETNEEQNISKDPNASENSDPIQNTEPTILASKNEEPEAPIMDPDEMPSLDNMPQFIKNNLKYPAIANENHTTGTVYISFIVEVDGSLTDIKTLRGIGDGCEQEAMRVVKSMPKWKPGRRRGKAVRVPCNLPIHFTLK